MIGNTQVQVWSLLRSVLFLFTLLSAVQERLNPVGGASFSQKKMDWRNIAEKDVYGATWCHLGFFTEKNLIAFQCEEGKKMILCFLENVFISEVDNPRFPPEQILYFRSRALCCFAQLLNPTGFSPLFKASALAMGPGVRPSRSPESDISGTSGGTWEWTD